MYLKTIVIVLIIFLLSPMVLLAVSVEGIQLNSITYIVLSSEPVEKSPAPGLITQGFGVSVPMPINSIFYFEPGINFYSSNVILDAENRPVLANIETANRISMLNFEIRPEMGTSFEVSKSLKIGLSVAPLISLKIPLTAYDYEDGNEAKQTTFNYFMDKGHFFSIYTAGVLKWIATESISLVVKTGISLPIYHLWDGENSDFYNFLTIQPEVGFIFKF